jgi:hypothetical protein
MEKILAITTRERAIFFGRLINSPCQCTPIEKNFNARQEEKGFYQLEVS